jgi:Pentapeptide repeats (9 copies)
VTTWRSPRVGTQETGRTLRLTAQRILTTHLHPEDEQRFWYSMRLDLTTATLVDFAFTGCRVQEAGFGGATFSGYAWFDEVTFSGNAWFDEAQVMNVGKRHRWPPGWRVERDSSDGDTGHLVPVIETETTGEPPDQQTDPAGVDDEPTPGNHEDDQ